LLRSECKYVNVHLVEIREMVERDLLAAGVLDPLAPLVLDRVHAERAVLVPKGLKRKQLKKVEKQSVL
jgi:hypothetical protein